MKTQITKPVWDFKYLIISDLHGVFVDYDLLELIIKLLSDKNEKFTHLIINGDGIDFFAISKFLLHVPNNPRIMELQYEIDIFRDHILKPIRKIFDGEIIFIRGNHEERLEKFLCSNSRALATLRDLQIDVLLGFNDYNIRYYPNKYAIGAPFNGFIYHGSRFGLNASKGELNHHGCNVICGHTHKTSFASKIFYDRVINCWHTGHIAKKSDIDGNCKYSEHMYWDQSFIVLNLNKTNFHVNVVKCDEKGFYYNGRHYKR